MATKKQNSSATAEERVSGRAIPKRGTQTHYGSIVTRVHSTTDQDTNH